MKPDKLNITFIGAGKIAHSFAGALVSNGITVSTVISRTLASAKELAEKYNIEAFSNQLSAINKKSNLIIFSVPDGELSALAKNISKLPLSFNNKTFIHLSGALNTDVLKPLANNGANTASFHILQTFPVKEQIPLNGCYTAIETGKVSVHNTLNALALRLELIPFSISSGAKTLYHIAGVFTSNFLAGNIFAAEHSINLTGIKHQAKELFNPIVNTTLKNITANGPVKALSGPVERNDIKTIVNHIRYMKKSSGKINNYIHLSYLAQSLLLTEIAGLKKGDKTAYKELNNSLVEELKKLVNLI